MNKRTLKKMETTMPQDNSRFVLFPIQNQQIWKAYKEAQASVWFAEEIDLQQDLKDWDAMEEKEKHFIKMVLFFFSSIDSVVNENLATRFYEDCGHLPFAPEARSFYAFQMMIEAVHSEVYALLIDTYVRDNEEKQHAFNAISNVPIIAKKAEYVKKWVDSNDSFAERLIAFAAIEGISFSSSFCAIFFERSRGKLPGLGFSNELISRDEGMHADFSCMMYSLCGEKVSQERAYEIIDEVVTIEQEFAEEALPVELIGMNSKMMGEYVKFVADRILQSLGFKKKYDAKNPFPFMEMISLQNKTNFFEKRVAEYSKSGVGKTQEENTISFDADF